MPYGPLKSYSAIDGYQRFGRQFYVPLLAIANEVQQKVLIALLKIHQFSADFGN